MNQAYEEVAHFGPVLGLDEHGVLTMEDRPFQRPFADIIVQRGSGHAVYSSKRDRMIHIGRIAGQYKYDPTLQPGYPNLRSVEWLKNAPRTKFTQGALYEIGSAISLLQVKNYAEEFLVALEGKPSIQTATDDATVGLVAEEIEQTTRDFIL